MITVNFSYIVIYSYFFGIIYIFTKFAIALLVFLEWNI